MKELLVQVGEWIWSVLEHWELIVASGVIAFIIDLADRFWEWKVPKKWYALFISVGLVLAMFASWLDEHRKVLAQAAYMEIRIDVLGLPPAPWEVNKLGYVNFWKINPTLYPATEESSIQELIIRPSPYPLTEPYTAEKTPSSPKVEDSVWDEMLKDREHGRHPVNTFDPGEKNFSSANTKEPVSRLEMDRLLIDKVDLVYFVGLDKWKDGRGTHGRSFCYWLHPPIGPLLTLEKCETHNDLIDDAAEYTKFFKQSG